MKQLKIKRQVIQTIAKSNIEVWFSVSFYN